jgi:hypothetical protein
MRIKLCGSIGRESWQQAGEKGTQSMTWSFVVSGYILIGGVEIHAPEEQWQRQPPAESSMNLWTGPHFP